MITQRNTQILPANTAHLLRQMVVASGRHMVAENKLAMRANIVRTLARTNHMEVPLLGIAPLFDGVRLITRTNPNWALYNLSHDPLYRSSKFPIPARDLWRLQRLYRSGIQFDALYVAHELPPDFRPGYDALDLSLFVPAPPAFATRLAEHLGHAADGIMSTCLPWLENHSPLWLRLVLVRQWQCCETRF